MCLQALTTLVDLTSQWRHNERDNVSNHKPPDCLLNLLFKRRSKKTPKTASLAFASDRWYPRTKGQ